MATIHKGPVLMALVFSASFPAAVLIQNSRTNGPFEVHDSRGRLRMQSVETPDGMFRLVLLDAAGQEVIALDPDAVSGPKVALMASGGSVVTVGSLADKEYGIGIEEGGKRRAWVQWKVDAAAQIGVAGRVGRPAGIMSSEERSGLYVVDRIGLMAAGKTELLWMGDAPTGDVDKVEYDKLKGVSVFNQVGHGSLLRVQGTLENAHVTLQDLAGKGSGLTIGGGQSQADIKLGISSKGLSALKVVDSDGATIIDMRKAEKK